MYTWRGNGCDVMGVDSLALAILQAKCMHKIGGVRQFSTGTSCMRRDFIFSYWLTHEANV